MNNTEERVKEEQLSELLEVEAQLEKLSEKQRMFIAGAIAALCAKPEKDGL